ncbi:MAG: hypothetical protein U0703_08880 [Anaerolineae bacterium]
MEALAFDEDDLCGEPDGAFLRGAAEGLAGRAAQFGASLYFSTLLFLGWIVSSANQQRRVGHTSGAARAA